MKRKSLPVATPSQSGLGLPTIMNRDLAAAHGVAYVHLAVFCIDIDRVYWLDPEDSSLPFGWEVFLTEHFVLHTQPAREILEGMCMELLEETPGEPPLGGQIVFAVFDAVQRGALDPDLKNVFSRWKNSPRELVTQLAELHKGAADNAKRLAAHCLQAELTPPLAPPTREALEKIASGQLLPATRDVDA
jgi:hypothetical protein